MLFEATDECTFPTEPAFLVPVEVKKTLQYGEDHYGVFASEPIPAQTKIWAWTDRVKKIHHTALGSHIKSNFGDDKKLIQLFLRQGFVLPGEGNDQVFNSNPTDAGRFMNHSNSPTCGPDGTLRDIQKGEELTMDYSFHGNPKWYRDICERYGVLTEAEIARNAK
uniref:SET domain-containing protein n=1 Tax=Mucochytrium quahogii TaxID=96639 RepID=A0A7S2WQ98_9STRA|mmetsp:Transcript_3541/g.5130  ORF Transcript_3541/g.5130 Transcript_3541/m.5130 type:complete len:165 (+) Transcript_3541:287-781(+)|eukprot:CAMPEP_0203754784 /NCGR_PEP_ID=MMETSP0098-20131031/8346_1 /ASSEMBLY_ACC=CAM_ASM_000208 /TAXON_ID=96639 /ORGANISM=" , Strain NY0313808BC1" /LENGTH=164 /DNA_ID=CAMNT_0050645975 /DNA_START=236 /DNA_END=730 /DNA_ORIENTATION=-